MKFSRKTRLMVIFTKIIDDKTHKKQGFTLSLEDTPLEKPELREVSNWRSPALLSLLRVKTTNLIAINLKTNLTTRKR